MNIWNQIYNLLLILLLPLVSVAGQEMPQVVVIVLADDLGYGDLSCYGAERIQTPHIDALASGGIQFMDAHSSSAVCTPSRYSLLTGQYAWRTRLKRGVLGGFDPALIETGRPTIGTLFQESGYMTACLGKWHLGMDWQVTDGREPDSQGRNVDYEKPLGDAPVDYGFDYFFGISASLDFPPYAFIENRTVLGPVVQEKQVRYDSQRPGLQADGWDDLKVDTTFIEKAVRYIHDRADAGEKFFLYLPLPAPHRPCYPPAIVAGKSQAGRRGDMVQLVDWGVGQIVEALRETGLLEESLLILSSDNGARPGDGMNPMENKFYQGTTHLPLYGKADVDNHGPEQWVSYGHRSNGSLRGYKTDIYEGGHRVPLIVYAPSIIGQASQYKKPVSLTDWYATFKELLHSRHNGGGEDSVSLMDVMRGGESARDHVIHHSATGLFAIREGKWKLVDGAGSGGTTRYKSSSQDPVQLFDLSADPAETRNVAVAFPAVVERLLARLRDVKKDLAAY